MPSRAVLRSCWPIKADAADGSIGVILILAILVFGILYAILVVSPGHHALTTSFIGLVVSAAKEWLSAVFPSFNNKIAIAAAVTLQDG